MRILHIVPSYKPAYVYGGPIVSVSRLCEAQISLGHEVTVYTTTANGEEELDVLRSQSVDVDGVSVIYFPRITGDHTHISPSLWIYLFKTSRQFDAIHIHSWWNFLVLGASLVCYIKGINPVLSVRGMLTEYSFQSKNSFKKRVIHFSIGRFLLRKSKLHATTSLEWQSCQNVIPNWKGFIAPNIIQFPDSLNNSDVCNDVFTIGTLSRVDPVKGLDLLIEALSYVTFPFILKIAGNGNLEYENMLKEKIFNLGLFQHVEWVGWQSGNQKFLYLQQLDLLAIPSYTENFSMVAIEALAVGTPVLVSDQVGLFNTISKHNWGWVTELSVKEIASNLKKVYEFAEQRKRIRVKAPKEVREVFDPHTVTYHYLDAYGQI